MARAGLTAGSVRMAQPVSARPPRGPGPGPPTGPRRARPRPTAAPAPPERSPAPTPTGADVPTSTRPRPGWWRTPRGRAPRRSRRSGTVGQLDRQQRARSAHGPGRDHVPGIVWQSGIAHPVTAGWAASRSASTCALASAAPAAAAGSADPGAPGTSPWSRAPPRAACGRLPVG